MPRPTKEMREAAAKGLAWREEYGRGGTEVGVARARDIVNNRNLSIDTVKRMKSYFARHEVDKQGEGWNPGEPGYPSAGKIAWYLWGSDAGRSWANKILQQEENSKMSERENRIASSFEVRADENGQEVTVEGYAAVFNQDTTIGGKWTERIAPGAFTDALGRDDVVFLVNHEGLPLARTRSGTLELSQDDHGLKIRASLNIADPDVRAIVPKMQRGDLDKMSFAFMPTRQSWDDEDEMPRRTIQEAALYDVSIVTTPAYEGTEIGLRSLEQHRKAQKRSQAARRLRMKAKLKK